jgi:HPt (histidine-containing phosphotransfer) domain-containing protein
MTDMENNGNRLFDALRVLKVDIDGTLSRFVDNDELYMTFLRRYPEDGLLAPVDEAFASRDRDAMIRTLHKMKGVSVNLGINHIAEQCEDITAVIRGGGDIDTEPMVAKLREDFIKVCDTIRACPPE